MRYRVDLGYIGTSYLGWQTQPQPGALQPIIEKAFSIVLRHPVRIVASSRTDAGVHAEQQVVAFETDQKLSEFQFLRSVAALTPKDIWYKRLIAVSNDFHPIHDATSKVYRYRLWTAPHMNSMVRPYVWHVPSCLDLQAMRVAAKALCGTHDFTSFCAIDSNAKTKCRTVSEVLIVDRAPLIDVWVQGAGFLKQMVRNLVGTLTEVAQGKREATSMPDVLAAMDRRAAGRCAPADGLSLVRVYYGGQGSCEKLVSEADQGFTFGF